MDIYKVDLNSSQLFQDWYLQEVDKGNSCQTIVDELETLGTAPGRIRAMHVAYWNEGVIQREPHFQNCLSSNDPVTIETAKGYIVYQRSVQIMREGGPHMKVRLSEMEGALTAGIKAVENIPKSDLVFECTIGLLIPLAIIQLNKQNLDEAIQTASQALFLAEHLNATITTARARTALIGCMANSGKTTATLELIKNDRQRAFRFSKSYTELELASCLFQLGNFEEGAEVLENMAATTVGPQRERVLEFQQRINTVWGLGGLEGALLPTPLGAEPVTWITASMREIILAYATSRESKELEERRSHFQSAVEICREAETLGSQLYLWPQAFVQWVKATAHLGRGEFADAAGVIEHAAKIDPDWFDVRVLTLGAGLELALSWHAPEGFSVGRYEHLLRKAFADAEENRYASPAGLARLLHRWHPTAAAYLALMPDPILACSFASKSVMKVGVHNYSCDDLSVSPVFACDLVLRALDFDLRRDFSFIQGDPGSSRKQKKNLLQRYGEVDLWRLPVSAVKIVYGLMGHQKQHYQAKARSIAQTYGIRPSTAALYPMIGVLDRVEQYSKELLDGHLTPKGFAAKMAALQ